MFGNSGYSNNCFSIRKRNKDALTNNIYSFFLKYIRTNKQTNRLTDRHTFAFIYKIKNSCSDNLFSFQWATNGNIRNAGCRRGRANLQVTIRLEKAQFYTAWIILVYHVAVFKFFFALKFYVILFFMKTEFYTGKDLHHIYILCQCKKNTTFWEESMKINL
jgi:hypothetical protein